MRQRVNANIVANQRAVIVDEIVEQADRAQRGAGDRSAERWSLMPEGADSLKSAWTVQSPSASDCEPTATVLWSGSDCFICPGVVDVESRADPATKIPRVKQSGDANGVIREARRSRDHSRLAPRAAAIPTRY
jgi:hypothetical protein